MNSQLASLLDKFFFNLKIIPGSDHCWLQRKYLQELNTEAATRCILLEKVFWETSQNSQENTRARGSFLVKLQASACKFC